MDGENKNRSTASQTALAVLTLIIAGENDHPAVKKGLKFLLEQQKKDGSWEEIQDDEPVILPFHSSSRSRQVKQVKQTDFFESLFAKKDELEAFTSTTSPRLRIYSE